MLYNTLLISLLKEEAQFFCFVGLLPEEQKASKTVTKNSMQKWANTIPMQLHCTAAAKATPCPVWNEEVELYALTFSGSSLPNYLLFVPSSSPPLPLFPSCSTFSPLILPLFYSYLPSYPLTLLIEFSLVDDITKFLLVIELWHVIVDVNRRKSLHIG